MDANRCVISINVCILQCKDIGLRMYLKCPVVNGVYIYYKVGQFPIYTNPYNYMELSTI